MAATKAMAPSGQCGVMAAVQNAAVVMIAPTIAITACTESQRSDSAAQPTWPTIPAACETLNAIPAVTRVRC